MTQGAAKVAVIGAGMAGLACAEALAEAGVAPVLFDKGRGAGGRMSTRRTEFGRFDHGAQYFTARSTEFRAALEGWIAEGAAAEWRGRFVRIENGEVQPDTAAEPRFVGAPAMNALLSARAERLGVRFNVRVEEIAREAEGWRLCGEDGADLGRFAAVAVATPAEQAASLLSGAPALAAEAAAARSAPCWALMLAFEDVPETGFDGAKVADGPIRWIAREASKPGRDPGEEGGDHRGRPLEPGGGDGRDAPADREPRAAGLRERGAETLHRSRDQLRHGAFLHQPV